MTFPSASSNCSFGVPSGATRRRMRSRPSLSLSRRTDPPSAARPRTTLASSARWAAANSRRFGRALVLQELRDPAAGLDRLLKILPPTFAADRERRARSEREAKTLAGLSHELAV